MKFKNTILTFLFIILYVTDAPTYPIDGYAYTNIKRLLYLQMVMSGEIKGTMPIPGAMKSIKDIHLNLTGPKGDSLVNIPAPDPELQKAINSLFPNLNENYSIAVLDITPGHPIRYAS